MPDRSEKWGGGWIHRDREGHPSYVIRKKIGGKLYEVSTRVSSERQAFKQLERFEADPEGYQPAGAEDSKGGALYLDAALAISYLTWCRDDPEKKNSPGWLGKQRGYIEWWGEQLKGVNLKKATLACHILPPLEKAKARPHRIAVIKGLYSYLRKERHAITPAEDPTFGTITVPQSDPNKRRIKDKAFPREDFLKVREVIDPHWKDAMDVQAGTGWHITETRRFAQSGDVEPLPKNMKADGLAGVLVCPETKAGSVLRTAVSAGVLEAAKRLRLRGTLSPEKYGLALKAACREAGVSEFTPGRFRHAVATWAINAGAEPAVVAAFLNHKSPRTTRAFYANFAVPAKVPTLL